MVAHLRVALLALVLAPSGALAADRIPNVVEVQFPSPPEPAKTPPKKRKRVRKAVVKETPPDPPPETSPETDPVQLPDKIERGPSLPGDEAPAPAPLDKSDFLPSKCPNVK